MQKDILERLRTAASNNRHQAEAKVDTSGHALDHAQIVSKLAIAQTHDEAADEIERLRLIRSDVRILYHSGQFKQFKGELWLERALAED
jgi:hypothetical protein